MYLLQLQRLQVILRDFQVAFPMALTPRSRTFFRSTASAPALRLDVGSSLSLSSPTTPVSASAQTPTTSARSTGEPVTVAVRVRRRDSRSDHDTTRPPGVTIDPATNTVTVDNHSGSTSPIRFSFDRTFHSTREHSPHDPSQQPHSLRSVGVDAVSNAFAGFNSSVIAYGPSGAGKTHAIFGSGNSDDSIATHTCDEIFSRINNDAETITTTITVSFFKVTGHTVVDLLDPHSTAHRLDQTASGGLVVRGLTELNIHSADDVALLLRPFTSDSDSTTPPNPSFFRIRIHRADVRLQSHQIVETTSTIQLVDLSGLWRRRQSPSHAGAESTDDNDHRHSLTTLDRVVALLAAPRAERGVVPFRDSLLTWLMRDCLAGNSKTSLVACVCEDGDDDGEDNDATLSALQHASLAAAIVTWPTANTEFVPIDVLASSQSSSTSSSSQSSSKLIDNQIRTDDGDIDIDDDVDDDVDDDDDLDIHTHVQTIDRLIHDRNLAADTKISCLTGQIDGLRLANEMLVRELALLREHVDAATAQLGPERAHIGDAVECDDDDDEDDEDEREDSELDPRLGRFERGERGGLEADWQAGPHELAQEQLGYGDQLGQTDQFDYDQLDQDGRLDDDQEDQLDDDYDDNEDYRDEELEQAGLFEPEGWAAEVTDLAASFLRDMESFRTKLGHDQLRFGPEMVAF